VDPEYLDVSLSPHTRFEHNVPEDYTAFAYVIEGTGYFEPTLKNLIDPETVVLFTKGKKIRITTNEDRLRFLLIAGKPIGEPVAWRGPIVMNTQQELQIAFEEYHKGTFIKPSEG